jgi:streptomycin 6-kinase
MTTMKLALPPRLVTLARRSDEGRTWLERLPDEVTNLRQRWGLSFDSDAAAGAASATCSFVTFVRRADGTPAVLKLGLPHMEAEREIDGLRFWNGDPSARLLEADARAGALLLERCEPGTSLAERPEPEQDEVIAALLLRLWRVPARPQPFRPLYAMLRYWADCAIARDGDWPDRGLARAGIDLLLELGRPANGDVLLATDLHAGNVLRASRQPWLVIDPKPFIGDPAYDATQHLLNCLPRVSADPTGTVTSMARRLGMSRERIRSWLFARLAVHTHARAKTFGLNPAEAIALARRLEKPAD